MGVGQTTSYHVEDLNPDNEKDWESLNETWDQGSFFHTLKWKRVVERTYGKRARYFLVYQEDTPVALCPLFESEIMRWSSLASIPVGDIRHLAISTPTDEEVAKLIVGRTMEIAKESKRSCVILISSSTEARDSIANACSNLKKEALPYPLSRIPFLDMEKHNPKDIWDNVFNSKKSQRKYIKRFEQSGYVIKDGQTKSGLDTFYKYYSENVNYIGGQPIDRSHFDMLLEEYGNQGMRISLLQSDEEVAGGLIGFVYPPQKTMYLRYLGMNRHLPSTFHPPYALFWDAINYAYNHGCRYVCFGSSSQDPDVRSHQVKMAFGSEYRDYYGQVIGRTFLFNAAYKSYLWSREFKDRKGSGEAAEAETS